MSIYIGTIGNDLINGSLSENFIMALAGKDSIFGGNGNDLINADEGNDPTKQNQQDSTIYEGKDDDFLSGDEGNDTLFGEQANDVILGGEGEDFGFGGDSNDLINGNGNNDTLHGNRGKDTVIGGEGNDLLHAGQDNDLLLGDRGNDSLYGDKGDDIALGGKGNDLLFGGEGNDFLNGNENDDTIEGGNGNDTLHGGQESDRLFGGEGDDILIGDLGADTVSGGAGNDIFVIGRRNDVPGFLTTGGVNIIDADYFLDFTPDEDVIELIGNLQFSELNIFAGSGKYANHTIIQDKGTTEYLAILKGVNTNNISAKDFIPITVTKEAFPGTLEFSAANFSVNEDGTPIASITINRTNGDSGIVSVKVLVNGGTAIGGAAPLAAPKDYDNNFITLTWADGDTTPKIVNIPIFNDTEVEGNETVDLTLSDPTNGGIIGLQNTAVLTIIDNDTFIPNPGILSFTKVNYSDNEGNVETVNKIVATIQRDSGSDGTVTVQVQLDTGSTATPNDFTNNLPITVTFLPGETSHNVEIPIIGDGIPEGNDTINLKLVNPTGGVSLGGQQTATYTIINDDLETVSLSATDTKAAETGDTGTYRISRGTNTIGALTVNLNIDGSSLAKSTDYILSGGSVVIPGSNLTVTIPDGQSFVDITLTPNDDIHAEADETLKLNLAAGSYNMDAVNKEGTVAIAANDTVVISLADDASINPNYANLEGTLRQAMLNAEAFAGTDTITFSGAATSGTINLTGVLPGISQNLKINGTGAANLNVRRDMGGEYRIFSVINGDFTIEVLTISNGLSNPLSTPFGGGVINLGTGTINVNNITFFNNQSNFGGGAIANLNGGTVNVINSTFTNNLADFGGIGGGILNAKGGTVNVSKSTFSGNESKQNFGGAIVNEGTLTVTDSSFSDNKASAFGGAISNAGSLVVTNSNFTNNKSGLNGGAISSSDTLNISKSNFSGNKSTVGGALSIAGTANITDSNFSENAALVSFGGAVYINTKDTVTIDRATLANNSANQGGAIWNDSIGTVKITNSTITNNTASNTGGGVVNNGNLDISNSTISGNKANRIGGGIYHDSTTSTFNINQSTITNNTADFDSNDTGALGGDNGGGIFIQSGNVNVKNTIVAANIDNSPFGGVNPDFSGNLTSKGYNLIGNVGTQNFSSNTTGDLYGDPNSTTTKNIGATEFITAIDPKLNPLANNGGLTQTHALQTGSLAINAGDPAFVAPPNTDQRGAGFDRIQGGRIDIGAVESNFVVVQSKLQFSAPTFTVKEDGTAVAAVTVTRTNGNTGAVSAIVTMNGGTAIGGATLAPPNDYKNTPITVNWADGDSTPKTVTIPIFNDFLVEGDETLNLSLGEPTGGATIGAQNTATLTIKDMEGLSLVTSGWQNLAIVPNNGDGTFGTPVEYSMSGSGNISAVTVADLNADSKLDLAAINYPGNSISVRLNQGNGVFAPTVSYPVLNNNSPEDISSADLDGDGDIDLASSGFGNNVSVLLNNGNGTFGAVANYPGGTTPNDITIGDWDRDNDLDLATSSGNAPHKVTVLRNNGNGTFTSGGTFGTYDSTELTNGDLDGDGDLDLISGNNTTTIAVLLNDGSGNFATRVNYTVDTWPEEIVVGDIDGDSDLDLVTANIFGDNISVLLNNGDATFATAVNYPVLGLSPRSLTLGDFDADGDRDVVAANYSSLFLFRNNGNGTFAAAVNYSINSAVFVTTGLF